MVFLLDYCPFVLVLLFLETRLLAKKVLLSVGGLHLLTYLCFLDGFSLTLACL